MLLQWVGGITVCDAFRQYITNYQGFWWNWIVFCCSAAFTDILREVKTPKRTDGVTGFDSLAASVAGLAVEESVLLAAC